MEERTIHLRIKVKYLAAEARIIRAEARKTRGMVRWGLNHHRKTVVRHHSRHNSLAYGLITGMPYEAMEKNCNTPPDLSWVSSLAKRFGGQEILIEIWIEDAKTYIQKLQRAKDSQSEMDH